MSRRIHVSTFHTSKTQVVQAAQLISRTYIALVTPQPFTIGRKRQEYRAQEEKPRRKDKADKNRPKNRNRGQAGRVRNMGNEESTLVDPSTRPFTLKQRTTEALAQYIKEGKAKKIVVLVSRVLAQRVIPADFHLDWSRHLDVCRHPRLPITRDRAVRESRTVEVATS